MGEALIAAILRKKLWPPSQIGIADSDPKHLQRLRRKLRIVSFSSNATLTRNSQVVLLAVKPQQMDEVLTEIRPFIKPTHLVLSIAAGLDTNYFQKRLPKTTRLIRIMPNMGALIGEGAAALYAPPRVKGRHRKLALQIFRASGQAVFVKREEWLDAVTAVSGSGPAFVFQFIDSLMAAGEKQKLPHLLCKTLVLQTLLGATKIAQESKEPLQKLIQKVASKGGTTEAGLRILESRKFRRLIEETITAATQRAKELRCIS